MGYFIMRIWWWERIKIGSSELSLGHGGPIDPRDDRYYFGETDFAVYFFLETVLRTSLQSM